MSNTSSGCVPRFVAAATAVATLIGAATGIIYSMDRMGYFDDEAAAHEGEDPEPEQAVFALADLSAQVNPQGFTGACPVAFEFLGRISTTGGPGTVTYRWLRSDGGEGPKLTLEVEHDGEHEVETTWRLGSPGWDDDGVYWQQIEVVEPAVRRSGKAEFTLRCPK